MKHLIVSLTLGTCLLVPSAGVVFAADPHIAPSANGTGQPGTGGVGISCGGTGTNGGTVTPPPGQVGTTNTNSPFDLSVSKVYAGAGAGNSGANSKANSQYDVACFQMH
jgi:hypothetical protein